MEGTPANANDSPQRPAARSGAAEWVHWAGFTSPIRAAFSIPLSLELSPSESAPRGDLPMLAAYFAFTLGLNGVALLAMIWLFKSRWRVSDMQ